MTEPANGDLTCRELVELVTAYFEETMSDADRARFERHVGDCPGCAAVVSQFRTTIEVTGRLTEDQVSAQQADTMREVFRRWRADADAAG